MNVKRFIKWLPTLIALSFNVFSLSVLYWYITDKPTTETTYLGEIGLNNTTRLGITLTEHLILNRLTVTFYGFTYNHNAILILEYPYARTESFIRIIDNIGYFYTPNYYSKSYVPHIVNITAFGYHKDIGDFIEFRVYKSPKDYNQLKKEGIIP